MDHPFLIVQRTTPPCVPLEDLAATGPARPAGCQRSGRRYPLCGVLALDVVYYELGSDIRAAVVDRIDRLVQSLD